MHGLPEIATGRSCTGITSRRRLVLERRPSAAPVAPARRPSPAPGPARRSVRWRARGGPPGYRRRARARQRLDGHPMAGARGAVGVPGALPHRTPGRSRRRDKSSRALVPVPWRSGTTATQPDVHPVQCAVQLTGSSIGQSPGGAPSIRRRAPARGRSERRRRRVAVVVGVAEHLERGVVRWACRRASRSARPSPVTMITRSISSARSVAARTSASIALISAARRGRRGRRAAAAWRAQIASPG